MSIYDDINVRWEYVLICMKINGGSCLLNLGGTSLLGHIVKSGLQCIYYQYQNEIWHAQIFISKEQINKIIWEPLILTVPYKGVGNNNYEWCLKLKSKLKKRTF